MTQDEFKRLPWLIFNHQVLEAAGYSPHTLRKMVDCGVLAEVRPPGCAQRKFMKTQLAAVLGLDVAGDAAQFRQEPLLMSEKAAVNWTGYTPGMLRKIAQAGGVHAVRLAGAGHTRYRKVDIAKLIGFERWL